MLMRQVPGAVALGLALFFLGVVEAKALSAEAPAPGYSELSFHPPIPGSYDLSDLGKAADGALIDSNGQSVMLRELIAGRMALISFIYSSCHETNGCPLATSVLSRVGSQLLKDPSILKRLTLLSISFDLQRDTPEVMARYGQPFQIKGVDWRFTTVKDPKTLDRLLTAYQQSLTAEADAAGRKTGDFSHILRVFLVDANGHIRNSYTPSVLHPDLVVADIKTLALALNSSSPRSTVSASVADSNRPIRAGDNTQGYEDSGYITRTLALRERHGRRVDLVRWSKTAGLGLPKHRFNVTPQGVALGRKLFFDRRLSLNGTVSCAMCHIPEQGFTSQEQSTAIGIEGKTVRRNAPTVLNSAHLQRLFHDGREFSLANQVWGPFLSANEMGNPSVGRVIETILAQPDYRGLFERVFGRGPTMETVGEALAQYESVLEAGDSPFDQWFYGKKANALGVKAQKGFNLFTGKAGCSSCHPIDSKGTLLTDQGFHNTGVGYRQSMGVEDEVSEVQLAPGIKINVNQTQLKQVSEPTPPDLGRYEITLNPSDRWAYRTPGLRNVALTAPYMHNGSLRTLEEVIDFYNQGGYANPGLDARLKPLGLTPDEKQQLVLFLESLTGSRVNDLVMDAWEQAVGDPGTSTGPGQKP